MQETNHPSSLNAVQEFIKPFFEIYIEEYFNKHKRHLTYGTAGYRSHYSIVLYPIIHTFIFTLRQTASKARGLIITASHNPIEDNGVKIALHSGQTLTTQQQKELELETQNNIINETTLISEQLIYLAYDTRPSNIIIAQTLVDLAKILNCKVIDLGYMTTPQFFYTIDTINNNIAKEYKLNVIKSLYSYQQLDPITIDCSNGVGGILFNQSIRKFELKNIKLIFNDDPTQLNNKCGSDYFYTNIHDQPNFEDKIAHLDGDADRLIYSIRIDNRRYIQDGNYIMALIVLLFKKLGFDGIQAFCDEISSQNMVEYFKTINIPLVICKCGINHLWSQIEKNQHNLCIGFERNGHGIISYQKNSNLSDEQNQFLNYLNQTSRGDGIMNLLLVEIALKTLNLTNQEWFNLYKRPYDIYISFDLVDFNSQKESISSFVEKLDGVVSYYIRQSGTELKLRLYVDFQTEDQQISGKSKIEQFFK